MRLDRWASGMAVCAATALAIAVGAGGGSAAAGRTPARRAHAAGLPAAARGPLSTVLGGLEPGYRIAGLRTWSPVAGVGARFGPHGAVIEAGSTRVGISLTAWGRGPATERLRAARPLVDANRVDYDHGPVTEWWANGPLGLEQGFEVFSRPAQGDGPLTLALGLSGTVRASLAAGGGSVFLQGEREALRYGSLVATDAARRALPAHMALLGGGRRLAIEVDDLGASYPIRVDPFVEQAELSVAGASAGALDGQSVATDGSTIVIGAPQGAEAAHGAAYVFSEPRGGWASTAAPSATLTASTDEFGSSVAIDAGGDTIAVGAGCHCDSTQGAIDAYTRPASGSWATASTPNATLSANDTQDGDGLGYAVAIDAGGDTIVAGAPYHKIESNAGQGAAFAFQRPQSGVWATTGDQTAELAAPSSGEGAGSADENLGESVAIDSSGDTIVAGAPGGNEAYVFQEPNPPLWGGHSGDVNQVSVLGATGASYLGVSVAISNDGGIVVAGAPLTGGTTFQGAGYVFTRPNIGWPQSALPVADLESSPSYDNASLGTSVAMSGDGDTVFAGATGVGDYAPGGVLTYPAAAVYQFEAPADGWPISTTSTLTVTPSLTLHAADSTPQDYFGQSVSLAGGTLAVGAPEHNVGANTMQGVAYAFGYPSPAVRIGTPANGGSYSQDEPVWASYSCSVTGATITACSGTVANGSPIDTASPGEHRFTVTATTDDGLRASATVSYTVAAEPVVSGLRQTHSRWRAGHGRASISRARHAAGPAVGTTFSFSASAAVKVTLAFSHAVAGRRAKGRCVPGGKRGRTCRTTVKLGTLALSARKGSDRVSFDGRVSSRLTLRPGSYTVTLAADEGRVSGHSTLTFTIVR